VIKNQSEDKSIYRDSPYYVIVPALALILGNRHMLTNQICYLLIKNFFIGIFTAKISRIAKINKQIYTEVNILGAETGQI
jgi:hypothetical protein